MLAHFCVGCQIPETMADVEIIGESIPRPTYLACMSDDLLARADIELVVGGETLLCHYPIMALHSKVFDKILADTLPRPNSDTTTGAIAVQALNLASKAVSHGSHPLTLQQHSQRGHRPNGSVAMAPRSLQATGSVRLRAGEFG